MAEGDYKAVFDALRKQPAEPDQDIQAMHDAFYRENGPCCAGCDHWCWINGRVGECRRAAPMSGAQRAGLLGITGCSMPIGAGHPLTHRDHRCGDFTDTFDWEAPTEQEKA